jgi:predicted O-linked N-acetylglucosamine transferase (SPINDLY family)
MLRVAEEHGISAERLIFAPRVAPPDYLARFQLADLFLDTFPYNAGTIASDALRMGLPVLTLSGQSFASRMAGSLVQAVGLPELATTSLADYTEAAIGIGTDTARHARLRGALAGDAWQRHIGDSAGFTARVEAAFKAIRLTP